MKHNMRYIVTKVEQLHIAIAFFYKIIIAQIDWQSQSSSI